MSQLTALSTLSAPTTRSDPAARALHLVDIENLAGGPRRIRRWFTTALRQYRRAAAPGRDDHIVVAADRSVWRRTAWDVDPGWRYLPGTGPDGADRVLLASADPEWVADRFGALVVGSGDHAFAPLAADLVARGLEVVVVARPRQLAGDLRRSGAEIRVLPDLPAGPVPPGDPERGPSGVTAAAA